MYLGQFEVLNSTNIPKVQFQDKIGGKPIGGKISKKDLVKGNPAGGIREGKSL